MFVLGFPLGTNKTAEKTFIYHDTIFGKGIIKFEIKNKDLSALPQLETIK